MRRLLAPLALIVVLTGCAGTSPSAVSDEPGESLGPDGLVGSWVLTDGTGPEGPIEPEEARPITLDVTADLSVTGSAGCNGYGTGGASPSEMPRLEGEPGALRFPALAHTEMGCDEATMAAETAYLAALPTVTAAFLQDGQLVLTGDDVRLVFTTATDEQPSPFAEAAGGWRLIEATDAEGALPVDASEVTLVADGSSVGGSAGCNSYSAMVTPDEAGGFTIAVGPTTLMACEEPAMTLETRYVAALQLVTALEVGDRLTLTGDGVALVFEPLPSDGALAGTWHIDGIVEGSGDSAMVSSVTGTPFLSIAGDAVTGNAGCRDFAGTLVTDGDLHTVELQFHIATTCPTDIAPQEDAISAVLSAFTVEETESGLTLTAAESETGSGLTLRR